MVVAIGATNRVIGKDGGLPWPRIKPDMDHFKTQTLGHPVLMGRKTWESLPQKFRPLPGRTNIVITRATDYEAVGGIVANNPSQALALAETAPGGDEVMVIGGAEIYNAFLSVAHRLILTKVHGDWDGDTYLAPYEEDFTRQTSYRELTGDHPRLEFVTLER
ncbi:MAG TPA: dihydrofolate reductase [Candidatus Paceibacterota bacterium]|nr:dihydrofolate reductase [Candidatus Paceibacterota bacterium]